MILAHLSDIHISRFGTNLVQTRSLPKEATGNGWEPLREQEGWLIEAWRASQSRFRWTDRLRLVDPDGIVHREVKVKGNSESEWIEELITLMANRMTIHADYLAEYLPSPTQLQELLIQDPENTNLRLCLLGQQLIEDAPDRVLVSGDLTDDAQGYSLVERVFRPWIDAGTFICIPGNHDIYPSPPLVTAPSDRRSLAEKRSLWGAFCRRIGRPTSSTYVHDLGEGVVMACLDSCHPPGVVPASASGAVLEHELWHVRGELAEFGDDVTKLACVHHHIANPPESVIGSAPIQAAMRLRNAREVLDVCQEIGIRAIFNGHRHLGFSFRHPGSPWIISAPSTTRGCRSGAGPFYWSVRVDHEGVHRVDQVPLRGLPTALVAVDS